LRWHPDVPVEGVADGGEGVAAVAAGGGEVGADAAVALRSVLLSMLLKVA
jgi:hypothetical protein